MTRTESHQAVQRKNSQNQPDTTSQQETPTAARQRGMGRKKGRNEKPQKANRVVGKIGENVRRVSAEKSCTVVWEKGKRSWGRKCINKTSQTGVQ